MKKRPRGRPPKDPDKVLSERIMVRLPKTMVADIEAAADTVGLSLSDWVRLRLHQAVNRQKRKKSSD